MKSGVGRGCGGLRLRVLLCASAMAVAVHGQVAFAQTAPAAPVRTAVDGNGVDLFDGTLSIDYPALTIGGSGSGMAFYKWRMGSSVGDNLTGFMKLSGSVMTVSIGKTTDAFSVSGTTYTSTEGNGATLTYNGTANVYTYTSNDGTVAHFDKAKFNDWNTYGGEGLITDLATPNGENLTFSYDDLAYCKTVTIQGNKCQITGHAFRLGSVTNGFGYKVTPQYTFDWIYDPNDPSNMPDLVAFSTPTGASVYNLAVSTAPQASQSVSYSSSGGSSYTTITDAASRQTKYRSATGVFGIIRPGNTTDDVTYTLSGSNPAIVTAVTTPAGATSYGRSDNGNARTVTVTDPLSHTTTYVFDVPSRRLVSQTNAVNQTTSYVYDGNGRVTRVTQPEGNYVQYTYDARGNVTETRNVAKTPGTPSDVVSSAGYDASCTNAAKCNKPNWTKDAVNTQTPWPAGYTDNQTDYAYDTTTGNVTTVTAPAVSAGTARARTTYSYTLVSGVSMMTGSAACLTATTCAGTANEAKVNVAYNSNGLPTSVTNAAGDGSIGATTAMAYDAMGNLTSVDGPLSGGNDTTVYIYDALRRRVGVMGPAMASGRNVATRVTYDTQGRVVLTEQGYTVSQNWSGFTVAASVATTYDTASRKQTESLKNGTTLYGLTQYGYDSAGRVTCATQRMNLPAYASLPEACTLQAGGNQGADRITRYTYDNADRVTQVQSAYGTAQQASETQAYTSNGQKSYVVDANGNRTTYEYDGHDRLVKTRYPVLATGSNASSGTDYELLTYGDNIHVTQRRLRDGNTINAAYDTLGRVTGISGATIPAHSFGYNLLGMQTASSISGGASLASTFDAFGRVTSEVSAQGTVAYQYDAASRRTRITWPDNFYVTYDYDTAGNTVAIKEYGATSGIQVLASYSYDALGRRTGVTYGNGTSRTYAYDGVNRLAGIKIDPAGTTNDLVIGGVPGAGTPLAYNPASQITSLARSNDAYAWTGNYNFNRNYTTNGLNQYTASGITNLSYDARGNLTGSVDSTNPNNSANEAYTYNGLNQLTGVSGGHSATLAYDPASRLYQVISGASTARFLYDGVNMIGEYNGSNALQRRFIPGPGTDEPIAWYEGASTTDRRWLQADERGSIVAVTDAAGNTLAINRYDEYGFPQGNTGRFQYTGQVWLGEVGLYYYKARMYSPGLGRFLQTDPIGYGDGLNWYNYTGGDPINSTDPSGLSDDTDTIIVRPTYEGLNCDICNQNSIDQLWDSQSFNDSPASKDGSEIIVSRKNTNKKSKMTLPGLLGLVPQNILDKATKTLTDAARAACEGFIKSGGDTQEGIGSALGVVGGAVGGQAVGDFIGGKGAEAATRLGRSIGGLSETVGSAARGAEIGARYGRVAGYLGVAAGAYLGWRYRHEIEDLQNSLAQKICGATK